LTSPLDGRYSPALMARAQSKATGERVEEALLWLKRRGKKANVDGMARYAIRSEKVFGVSVADTRRLAKRLGRDHVLAEALWATGWYEARMLAAFVDDPARVTPAQMDRWCRDFDNWAICDTVCFHLFDRTPHAWRKVERWAGRRDEFVKRAGALSIVEGAAGDDRNFVKKSVSWALRGIGGRSVGLNAAAVKLAQKLSTSPHASARWVGKDALRAFASPAAAKRLAANARKASA
jgi:3-methyladenine DNA glycosylase AlkD